MSDNLPALSTSRHLSPLQFGGGHEQMVATFLQHKAQSQMWLDHSRTLERGSDEHADAERQAYSHATHVASLRDAMQYRGTWHRSYDSETNGHYSSWAPEGFAGERTRANLVGPGTPEHRAMVERNG